MKYLLKIAGLILFILSISLVNSCKKDKPALPSLTTVTVVEISYSTATSGGNITNEGGASVISRGVCWDTSASPTTANSITSDGGGAGGFKSNLSQLSSNTLYYLRAYAVNSVGTAYGNQVTFTTSQLPIPVLTTAAINSITSTTATTGGNITADYGLAISSRGVCWSTSANPTISDYKTTDGTGSGSFVSNLNGLAGNTTYYLRAYATNSIGTGYGDQLSFTTLLPLPTLTTTVISSITSNSCVSGGTIINDGGYPIIQYGVCWSMSPHPTKADQSTSDGSGVATFSSSITSLSQNSTYYVRAYADNNMGTGYGNELSFTTPSYPILFNPNSTYGTLTDVDGNVYKTITIGSQTWMAENLKTTRYQNGESIGTTLIPNSDISAETTPEYQWAYNGVESNVSVYGRLYTWYVGTDSRNVCPAGWHVSTDAEWLTLTNFLGGSSIAGGQLKEVGLTHWISPNTGATNETGFTALPGGYRFVSGLFYGAGTDEMWWTSNQISESDGTIRGVEYNIAGAPFSGNTKSFGVSIRCIKD
jgi:uncharacterized protein (TIGR02145 family)